MILYSYINRIKQFGYVSFDLLSFDQDGNQTDRRSIQIADQADEASETAALYALVNQIDGNPVDPSFVNIDYPSVYSEGP